MATPGRTSTQRQIQIWDENLEYARQVIPAGHKLSDYINGLIGQDRARREERAMLYALQNKEIREILGLQLEIDNAQ